MAGPSANMPYVGPITLWLVGFFPIMAFVSRGKLSALTGLASVGYIFLLPAYLLGTLSYNFVLCPKKYRKWDATFMCQRSATLVEPLGPGEGNCHTESTAPRTQRGFPT
jgi:hypothetical protein